MCWRFRSLCRKYSFCIAWDVKVSCRHVAVLRPGSPAVQLYHQVALFSSTFPIRISFSIYLHRLRHVIRVLEHQRHTSSSNQFCNRHPVCIIYFRHLAILNYFLASGLPQNIPESPIEPKIPVVHLLRLSPLPVVLVCFLVYNVHVYR